MNDRVYQVLEVVGTSQEGIEDAVNNAIAEAGKLHGKLNWFEIVETRGFIEDNKSKYYQVRVKIGCHTH